ncbi:MAG: GNAT family N-acetyltransferase [Flavobacteriaceae bacterium]|nr:GNAT family N-acetyltransferase [Flavobacteriaceae bacterium]
MIREITPKDNAQIAVIIRETLIEFDMNKAGTAFSDPAVESIHKAYSGNDSVYFVVEEDGKILGGAGISQLDNFEEKVCELQKMYFSPLTRGRGIGTLMIEECLKAAKDLGYLQCYLETIPEMKAAQKLSKKQGFNYLDKPMGDTGHHACPVWMLKTL